MSPQAVPFYLPELDLGPCAAHASLWHAGIGASVHAGQRLLEVVAGEVLFDLPAPISGVLTEKCVFADDPLEPGQRLGCITPLRDGRV